MSGKKRAKNPTSGENLQRSGGSTGPGAVTAGLARVRARVDEIFHARQTVRGATEEGALDALRLLYEAMGNEDPRVRAQAVRDYLYVWGRLPPAKPEDEKPKMSAEEERAAVVAALKTPEVRAVLLETGWSPPKEQVS